MAVALYCLADDVKRAIAPSGSTDGTAYSASVEEYEDAILEAMSVVDTHVAARYVINVDTPIGEESTPIYVAPYIVRYWTRDIAAYLLTLTHKRNKDVTEDDPVRQRYEGVLNQLRAVSNGSLSLTLPLNTNSGSSTITVVNQYEGVMFSPDQFDLAREGGSKAYGGYYGR